MGVLPANWTPGGAYPASAQNLVDTTVNSLFPTSTSQASSATTLTLTATSNPIQIITGTTQAQTVALPTTAVVAGDAWMVVNSMTTAAVTVNASGGATVTTLAPGTAAIFTATAATPTTAAGWLAQYAGTVVAAGKVLTVNNTLTLAGTDGTTMTFPTSSDTLVGLAAAQTLTSKKLSLAAGASAAAGAPLYLASGTSLATPAAGAFEYDGTVFYQTPAASTRHVSDCEQFCTLTSAYTLTSQTAAQKIFNASTNGAVTLPIGSYFFECFFALTALSATSGSFGFGFGGTIASQLWWSTANKATALATAGAAIDTVNTAAVVGSTTTGIAPANTSTTGWAHIKGKLVMSAAGAVTPQITLGVAAAAIVAANSWFRIVPVGLNTVTNVGNWS